MTIKRYNVDWPECEPHEDETGKWCYWEDADRIVAKIASHRERLLGEVKELRAELDAIKRGMPDESMLEAVAMETEWKSAARWLRSLAGKVNHDR